MNRRDLILAGSAAIVLNACALNACAEAPPQPRLQAPVAIPFKAGKGGHIYLPITVNGIAALALLDNGWWRSGLDRSFALAHGLIKTASRGVMAKGVTLNLAGIEWRIDAATETLGDISAGDGVTGVVAVIGAEFFAAHVVQIDFIGKQLTVHDAAGFTAPAGFTEIALTSPRKAGDARLAARIEGGSPINLVFDLGGGHDGLLFKPGAVTDRLLEGRPSVPSTLGAFRGGEAKPFPKARLFSVREVAFAGFVMTDVPAAIGDDQVAPRAELNAGSNLLQRFDLIFDTGGQRLWLRPNAQYSEPFHYDLMGNIGMTLGPRPATFKVVGVQPGSPVEKAGLKAGDIIVRFQGQAATVANLEAYKAKPEPKAGDVVEFELDDGRTIRTVAARFY